jgi:hypothetical protein
MENVVGYLNRQLEFLRSSLSDARDSLVRHQDEAQELFETIASKEAAIAELQEAIAVLVSSQKQRAA